MSNKYRRLTDYLSKSDQGDWRATFEQIERILGFKLPDSARQYQAWWSNQMRSQSLSWQLAGWKATALDLDSEEVTFVYVGSGASDIDDDTPRMTISEAKSALAATFGVDPSQIDITIRG